LPEIITIDGRGNSIPDAIKEMWSRMGPLEQKGFNPISDVEIVDESSKEIIQTFQLSDPEFQLHLKSDAVDKGINSTGSESQKSHSPERKGHYKYVARLKLAS
jgi:hypothetical protein